MEAILGTWKNQLGTEKNLKELLDALKVPESAREGFMKIQYEITYTKGDADNSLKVLVKKTGDTKTQEKTYDFEMGKEFETEDVDGQKIKGTVTFDGSKFTEDYTIGGDVKMLITREIGADGVMKMSMTTHGVTSTSDWIKC